MNERIIEAIKYGVSFAFIIIFFFGGSYILKGALGTEYPMMVVVSQSMQPTLGVGDFIFVGGVDAQNVNAAPAPQGDIIVFIQPYSNNEYIVHRAIEKYTDLGTVTYTTKGDNNIIQDGWRLPATDIVGKVIGNIPLLGYFSIFIKTVNGFAFVTGLMLLSFLIDYVLPKKTPDAGRFPIWSLIPALVGPIIIALFWFIPSEHFYIEIFGVIIWYLSCIITPLAFYDDDGAMMVWLYTIVLFMVPIACDIVYWSTRITPSSWWSLQAGAVQANWMLLQVTEYFEVTFWKVMQMLIPGCVIFVITLYAKRRRLDPFWSLSRRIRGAPPEQPPTPIGQQSISSDERAI